MDMFLDGAMLESAGRALLIILEPTRMLYLAGAVMLGLCIGILPGIGGLTGFALLLPFTFTMDPYTAYACLLGMAAVVNTSDTIPSILLGVPGTAASQATVLDGLPLTRKGEAGRALAAAYVSSMMGGIFGVMVLAMAIPVVRPVVLAIGTPELLGITVLAIALVASLSGSTPLRGMVIACFGVMLAMIGASPQTGTLRWTMGTFYLWDGLPLLPIVLGLYALPELCDLAIKKSAQYTGPRNFNAYAGMWRGARDAVANWFLVMRCSSMGAAVGAIPGLSGSVVDWLAYGHALNTEKGARETFGKGDIRGVIAPESANNATEGGGLIPTLAFGVPGSASMALLIGALMIHGITPGPDMLGIHLDLTYSMMWSIAIANVIGAGICFALSGQFARLAFVRYTLILPAILTIVYVGAFQASRNWGDLYALLLFGLLGWIMKRIRWPRPPLIMGFVLGLLIERYMSISIMRYDFDWLQRPLVIGLLCMALLVLLQPIIKELRRNGTARFLRPVMPRPGLQEAMYLFFLLLIGYMVHQASGWKFEARIGPMLVGVAALVFAGLGLVNQLFFVRSPAATAGSGAIYMDLASERNDLPVRTLLLRSLTFFGWLVGFMASMSLIGIIPTIPLFVVALMRIENREPWRLCLIYAAVLTGCIYLVFDQLLHLAWPRTMIGIWFPELRGIIPSV